jgi:hypothetical protein
MITSLVVQQPYPLIGGRASGLYGALSRWLGVEAISIIIK